MAWHTVDASRAFGITLSVLIATCPCVAPGAGDANQFNLRDCKFTKTGVDHPKIEFF